MSCSKREKYHGYYFQEWPKDGQLKNNMNLELDKLTKRLENYSERGTHYTVKSIVPSASRKSFVQIGCGPNFEGGVLSQCTCRHDIRAKYYVDWNSKWLAGFTGYGEKLCGASYLFYLMKIKNSFESFKKLYEYYRKYDEKIIEAKRSDKNPLGDLYIPIDKELEDEHNPAQYYDTCEKHSHYSPKGKLHDINYPNFTEKHRKKKVDKHAKLLLGDLEHGYLWNEPKIRYVGGKAPRHKKWDNIQELLDMLEPVSDFILPEFKKRKKQRKKTC